MSLHKHNLSIYTHLAPVYDDVMRNVDYEDWADFIDALIVEHNEEARSVLELGCGTGTLSLLLDELDVYDITATDISPEMLQVARDKADFQQAKVTFEQVDFTDIRLNGPYDVVFLVFDGINYLTTPESVTRVMQRVRSILTPETGIFILDFTTPHNSQRNAEDMNDEGVTPDNWRFVRVSRFLEAEKLHYNEFTLEKLSDKEVVLSRHREVHVQRVYTLAEMRGFAREAGFAILAEYDGFDMVPATANSDRVTLVLQ